VNQATFTGQAPATKPFFLCNEAILKHRSARDPSAIHHPANHRRGDSRGLGGRSFATSRTISFELLRHTLDDEGTEFGYLLSERLEILEGC
jgi:hypothetical protein